MTEEPEPEDFEVTEPQRAAWKRPTLAGRLLRIVAGGIAVYVITLFLTIFFWTGFPNPNGPALIATGAFVLLAAVLTVRLSKT